MTPKAGDVIGVILMLCTITCAFRKAHFLGMLTAAVAVVVLLYSHQGHIGMGW